MSHAPEFRQRARELVDSGRVFPEVAPDQQALVLTAITRMSPGLANPR